MQLTTSVNQTGKIKTGSYMVSSTQFKLRAFSVLPTLGKSIFSTHLSHFY